jgi:hypothetical protein
MWDFNQRLWSIFMKELISWNWFFNGLCGFLWIEEFYKILELSYWDHMKFSLSIYIGNSCKLVHPHKLTYWSAFNWSIEHYSYGLQHLDKLNFLSAFNWLINVGNICNLEHVHKSNFSNAFHWPIEVGNFCKLKHPNKVRFWSAFNWSIDVGNFYKFKQLNKLNSWSAFN